MRNAIERIEGRVTLIVYFLEQLRNDFEEAIGGFEECSQYKGDYLRDKHGDEKEIARLRQRLAQLDEIIATVKTLTGSKDNGGLRV